MYLKRLEMFGFKSFADRAIFDFEPGMTCLVGPNGCGKSNVVDALKWVMGEQSAKSLRGKDMQDVIFNGTSSRKPLGYAEVALGFDNTDRSLPVEYDEVVIGRRLYRDGTSEYFINKQLCRLRDLKELFMDTGMGVRSYSVIEQGKVDVLLQASSKERRLVFEEAAGISRYRVHKQNALRRLDRVEKNLDVLRAYVGEVEKQLRSVVRQANRARRFQSLSEQLKDKRAAVALADYAEALKTLQEVRESVKELADLERTLEAEAGRIAAQIAEHETSAAEAEDRRRTAEKERFSLAERISQIETDTAVSRRSLEQESERVTHAEQEAAELRTRSEEMRGALAGIEEQIASADQQTQQRQAELDDVAESADTARRRVTELEAQLDESRGALVDLVRKRSTLENQLAGLEAERRAHAARLHRSEQQLELHADRLEEIAQGRSELEAQRSQAEARAEELAQTVARMKQERGQVEQRLAALDEQITSRRTKLGGVSSRLGLLEDLERRYEGLSAGVRGLLSALRDGSAPFNGNIAGLVADLVTVDLRFTPAIESALGEEAQAIVTRDAQTALAAADWLAQGDLGRATFRPLDQCRRRWTDLTMLLGDERIVGVASSLVEMAPEHRDLAQALLGHVLVVQDREAARELAGEAQRAGVVLVTLQGERFDPEGAITAGAAQGEILGLVSRKNEITRLRESRDQHQQELEKLRAQRMAGETRAVEQTAKIEHLSDERADAAQQVVNLAGEISALTREDAQLQKEVERLRGEVDGLRGHDRELDERHGELAAQRDDIGGREEELRRQVTEGEQELVETREASGRLSQQLSDVRVAHTESAARLSRLQSELERSRADVADAEARIGQQQEQAELARQRREELSVVIETSTRQLVELTQKRDGLETEISKLAGRSEELRQELEALRRNDRESAEKLRETRDGLSQERVRENSARMTLEHLVNDTRRELNRDLAREYDQRVREAQMREVEVEGWMWNYSERLPAEDLGEEVTPDLDVTPELREEIEELTASIEKLGAVNVAAIDEEAQLRERTDFLAGQKKDLERARNSLKDVVARLNRKSRLLFQETFMQVQANFQELFRKLFGGGRAELKLEDHEDVLEAGIEIIARPPGKQPRSLTLLSGGEKTMTTIALLFAIFKSKPSPLCVLDEVDAPLDDANVDRFNLIIQEFMDTSQFMVITHNKQTMTYASSIFGVTQEEAGVSKKISVRLEELDHHLQVAD